MSARRIVLTGQGRWSRLLAEGLARHTGLEVGVAPLDGLADAAKPRTWRTLLGATTIVRVGFRPGAATWRGRALDAAFALVDAFGRRHDTVYYWIGSDVARATADLAAGRGVRRFRRMVAHGRHMAGSEPLRADLSGIGVDAELVDFAWEPAAAPLEPAPLPDEFGVQTYVPDARYAFYGGPEIIEAARALPDVRFRVMGGTGGWAVDAPANVEFLGWVGDPAPAYTAASCVVRMVEYDSIGGTAVEGLLAGRPVVYSRPLEHTIRVPFGDAAALTRALAGLRDAHAAGTLTADVEAAAWARRTFDPAARFRGLARAISGGAEGDAVRRIAYLTLQATREGQAAHAHVHEIVAGLRAIGWRVDLYEPDYGGEASPSALRRLREFLRVQRRLARASGNLDAVYVRAHFAAWPTARRMRRRGVPVVQEINGPYSDVVTAWPSMRALEPAFTALQRWQFAHADALIAVTANLADGVNAEIGRGDTVVIGNGANTEVFRPGLAPLPGVPGPYAVFIGALAPWQGISTILSAARSGGWPAGVALVVAGDGAMRREVEAAAAGGNVTYLGSVPYTDAARLVSNAVASLVVQDTLDRAMSGISPLKLYEAMAAGTPVIASDMPGLADTVSSCGSGIVVAPGDPDAVAAALSRIVDEPDTASAMGERGRACAVAEFSWASAARRTADVVESAIRRRRAQDLRA